MILNLTPHKVTVYELGQFVDLRQVNVTTWVAQGVEGDPIAVYDPYYPDGGCARIAVATTEVTSEPTALAGVLVTTVYGDATGIPEGINSDDELIVSTPMLTLCKNAGFELAAQMRAPYQVVRDAADTARVLGCTGFTK